MSYIEIYSLLSAYNIEHISKMPLTFGVKAIFYEIEKKEERKAWEMWLALYPNMGKKNFIPFTKFYKKMKQPIDKTPTEDILKDIESIRKAQKKEGE
jgi:hypothetical protein